MAGLTAEERQQYEIDGYVIPAFELPSDRVDHPRAVLDKPIADNPGFRPEKLRQCSHRRGNRNRSRTAPPVR